MYHVYSIYSKCTVSNYLIISEQGSVLGNTNSLDGQAIKCLFCSFIADVVDKATTFRVVLQFTNHLEINKCILNSHI